MSDIKDLIRKNIKELIPYSSARDEYSGNGAVLLDANESPYNEPFNRYPDPVQMALKEKISGIIYTPVEQIFLGNGSDEAIDLLIRIFCEPAADRIIIIDPSYGMYKVCADINNVAVDFVSLNDDFSLDAERVLAAVREETKMIFLCSPNNPSANLLAREEITRILSEFKGMVVLDEAYIDFCGTEGLLPSQGEHWNLVILRTLSKAWGLAGIRLGMALADPEVIQYMNRIKYPYKRIDFDPDGERHAENRGKAGYERISWDEALDIVEGEIKRISHTYGSSAITGLTSSHHNWGIVGYKMGPFSRF